MRELSHVFITLLKSTELGKMTESVLKTGAKTEFKEGIMFTVLLLDQ